jgi:hypothetical protein
MRHSLFYAEQEIMPTGRYPPAQRPARRAGEAA